MGMSWRADGCVEPKMTHTLAYAGCSSLVDGFPDGDD